MIRFLDCTLRDGANVLTKGYSFEMTRSILSALIGSGVSAIELGNAKGLGVYPDTSRVDVDDAAVLKIIEAFSDKADVGLFLGYANADADKLHRAKERGAKFIRVGANAGFGERAATAVEMVKNNGLMCRYSLMKGYVLSAEELVAEAKLLQDSGVDGLTLMDSAGTMLPTEVKAYIDKLVSAVSVPIGFHGHNNLGLAAANAIAAVEAGASEIDVCLMGTGRSAGNLPTEVAAAVFERMQIETGVDHRPLAHYIEKTMQPYMEAHGFSTGIQPLDLVYGYNGCHSNFGPILEKVAKEHETDLFDLIESVSEIERRVLTEELAVKVAETIRR